MADGTGFSGVTAGRDSASRETTVRAKFRMDADGETRDAIRWSLSGPTKTLVRGMAGLVGTGSLASVLYLSMRNSTTVNTMLGTVAKIFGAFVDLIAIQFLPIFLAMVRTMVGTLGNFANFMAGGGGGFAAFMIEAGTALVKALMSAFDQAWPDLLALMEQGFQLFGKVLHVFLDVVTSPGVMEAFVGIAMSFASTIIKALGPFLIGIALFMMGRIVMGYAIGAAINGNWAGAAIGFGIGASLIGAGIGSEVGAFNSMQRGGSGYGGAFMGSQFGGLGSIATMGGV